MNAELQNKLYEKYPKIFEQKDLPMTQTAMCWGISCGDGWYNIIDNLCNEIQQLVDRPHENIARYKIIVSQELEKGEGADMLWIETCRESIKREESKVMDQVVATQVKEKFGSLRFYVNGGNDTTDSLISFAESMSFCTCESCGRPGQPSDGGWIYVRCDDCT
jgi:hypothetical protein